MENKQCEVSKALNRNKSLSRRKLNRILSDYISSKNHPHAPWHNAVLKRRDQYLEAIQQVSRLHLPLMDDPPKNWDALAALDIILNNTDQGARIFDAGGEYYSRILVWLYLYGYENLAAGNLVFGKKISKGPVKYLPCDITRSGIENDSMDAVTCLSVLEHGVDINDYFMEMSRILRPGGILVTSIDYFDEPVDTKGQVAYGVPIRIFDRTDVESMIATARRFDLELTGELDLDSDEKVVTWTEFGLQYTFAIFSMKKKDRPFPGAPE